MAKDALTVQGLELVKRAFKELEPRVARKVIRAAEREAAKVFAAEITAHAPEHSGKLRRTVKVRASKGPRSSKKGNISIAVLVGQAGGPAAKGFKTAWYAYLQEKGFHVGGKRVRTAGKTVGYAPLAGHLGSKGVRFIPGKRFTKRALRGKEGDARQKLMLRIAEGIEREAGAMARR
jgi:HK97 gp10 family phage protein